MTRTPRRGLLDEHTWAATNLVGDAQSRHASFSTVSYIEIYRADCWAAVGQSKKAIALYEKAPILPTVYQRDRAAGLTLWPPGHVSQDKGVC